MSSTGCTSTLLSNHFSISSLSRRSRIQSSTPAFSPVPTACHLLPHCLKLAPSSFHELALYNQGPFRLANPSKIIVCCGDAHNSRIAGCCTVRVCRPFYAYVISIRDRLTNHFSFAFALNQVFTSLYAIVTTNTTIFTQWKLSMPYPRNSVSTAPWPSLCYISNLATFLSSSRSRRHQL